MKPYCGILLLGPTGSGKTPLGTYCEQNGLWQSKVFHFDFGARLRRIAAGAGVSGLSDPDVRIIRESLRTGALLENRHFHIARQILVSFASERRVSPADWILLNGLPRHAGQAEAIEPFIRIKLVAALSCTPTVVKERIRCNTGGDRARRKDDGLEAIERKLAIFRRQTAPLLRYYRQKGIPILSLAVGVKTTAQTVYRRLIEHGPPS